MEIWSAVGPLKPRNLMTGPKVLRGFAFRRSLLFDDLANFFDDQIDHRIHTFEHHCVFVSDLFWDTVSNNFSQCFLRAFKEAFWRDFKPKLDPKGVQYGCEIYKERCFWDRVPL
jgi:hypothetical protein